MSLGIRDWLVVEKDKAERRAVEARRERKHGWRQHFEGRARAFELALIALENGSARL